MNIVNRIKKSIMQMQQNNEEMTRLNHERDQLFAELEAAIKTSSAIIKEMIEKMEREVS